eukprot:2202534-Rhodomonas_salina.3
MMTVGPRPGSQGMVGGIKKSSGLPVRADLSLTRSLTQASEAERKARNFGRTGSHHDSWKSDVRFIMCIGS